jgi:hypothetical protein
VSEYLKRDNLRTVLDDESVRIGPQLIARMMRDICKGMSVIHKYLRRSPLACVEPTSCSSDT